MAKCQKYAILNTEQNELCRHSARVLASLCISLFCVLLPTILFIHSVQQCECAKVRQIGLAFLFVTKEYKYLRQTENGETKIAPFTLCEANLLRKYVKAVCR